MPNRIASHGDCKPWIDAGHHRASRCDAGETHGGADRQVDATSKDDKELANGHDGYEGNLAGNEIDVASAQQVRSHDLDDRNHDEKCQEDCRLALFDDCGDHGPASRLFLSHSSFSF